MRIGEFAKKHDISVDALRHYMAIGLLVVEKKGGQYAFDSKVSEDLSTLRSLKSMGFSLSEIKKIFLYQRLALMTNYQRDLYYQSIFSEKRVMIRREITEKNKALEKLILAEKSFKTVSEPSENLIGVPLEALDLFCCPVCNSGYRLKEAQIIENKVRNGHLTCGCNRGMVVSDGILYASSVDASMGSREMPDTKDSVLEAYLTSTDEAYLDRVYQGLNWVSNHSDFTGVKVAMELGSGYGFYLRTMYSQLPETLLYIAVDRDPSRHLFLKKILEAGKISKNILLLCAPFEAIPLRNATIDCILDFSGTSNYSFEHSDFLLERVNALSAPQARLYASYIIFDKFGFNTQIAIPFRDNFKEKVLRKNIEALGYRFGETHTTQATDKGGAYEDYFASDESIHTFLCTAFK